MELQIRTVFAIILTSTGRNTSEEKRGFIKMRLVCSASDKVKEVQVTFIKLQNANEEPSLYAQTIRFPVFSTKEGANS